MGKGDSLQRCNISCADVHEMPVGNCAASPRAAAASTTTQASISYSLVFISTPIVHGRGPNTHYSRSTTSREHPVYVFEKPCVVSFVSGLQPYIRRRNVILRRGLSLAAVPTLRAAQRSDFRLHDPPANIYYRRHHNSMFQPAHCVGMMTRGRTVL